YSGDRDWVLCAATALRHSLPSVLTEMTASSQTLTSRSSVRLMAASRRTTEAPPRPSSRRGRISERLTRPELTTVPLKSRPDASPFWIMLLLSSTAFEHGMMDADRTPGGSGHCSSAGLGPALYAAKYQLMSKCCILS